MIDAQKPKSNNRLGITSLTTGTLTFALPLLAWGMSSIIGDMSNFSLLEMLIYLLLLISPFVLTPVALITGVKGIIQIRHSGVGSKDYAIPGLILGNIAFFVCCFFSVAVMKYLVGLNK